MVLPDLETELVSGEIMLAVPLLPLPAIWPLTTIVVNSVDHMLSAIFIDGDHFPFPRVTLISVIGRSKRVPLKDNRLILNFDLNRDLASSLEVGLGSTKLIFGFL